MSSLHQRGQQVPVGRSGSGAGRALELVLSLYATAVFVVLWVYIAAAVLTDGTLLADSWAWCEGLEVVGRVVAGIALLPVVVFLWAWQADLEPLLFGLVMGGLLAWSIVAFRGAFRVLPRLARR